jgi:hypothetical protein
MSNTNNNTVTRHILQSSGATVIAEIATLPICTIKTCFQNAKTKQSVTQICREIYSNHGIAGFYRASLPAIGSQVISTSLKWTLYQKLKEKNHLFQDINSAQARLTNGLLSGIIPTLITHPLDVAKVHWQMRSPFPGWRYAMRGYSKTLSKIAVGSVCYYPFYEYFKDVFAAQEQLSRNQKSLLSGICSGLASTLIVHPIDFLKTRHIYNQPLFLGWNPTAYYKGLTLNVCRVVPHFAITMFCIDVVFQQ